jgi:hypothetical protein
VTETALGFRPYIMLVAAVLLYGLMFSFNKVAADAGITPFAYTFWQSCWLGFACSVIAPSGDRCRAQRWPTCGHMESSARLRSGCRSRFSRKRRATCRLAC